MPSERAVELPSLHALRARSFGIQIREIWERSRRDVPRVFDPNWEILKKYSTNSYRPLFHTCSRLVGSKDASSTPRRRRRHPTSCSQRGNAPQVILADDADRVIYIELLRQNSEHYGLALLGYCLMSKPCSFDGHSPSPPGARTNAAPVSTGLAARLRSGATDRRSLEVSSQRRQSSQGVVPRITFR